MKTVLLYWTSTTNIAQPVKNTISHCDTDQLSSSVYKAIKYSIPVIVQEARPRVHSPGVCRPGVCDVHRHCVHRHAQVGM